MFKELLTYIKKIANKLFSEETLELLDACAKKHGLKTRVDAFCRITWEAFKKGAE